MENRIKKVPVIIWIETYKILGINLMIVVDVQNIYTENYKTVGEIRKTNKCVCVYVFRRSNCLQVITHPTLINK